MTSKLQTILQLGENHHIEFKRGFDKSLIEEVCAFANASGGKILLGIDDKGRVIGLDSGNKVRSKVQDLLRQLKPSLDIFIEIEDDNVIIINVPSGEEKPYACSKGFFMRMGANTQKLDRNEIINFYKSEGRIRFEELISKEANFERDFDSNAFRNFILRSGITSNLKPEVFLQNFKCLTSDKNMTNLGVLFFVKDLDIIMNYAMVDCILFHGTERIKILNRKQYKNNLLENIENALAFIQKHTKVEYVIEGIRREEIPDYPEIALREAIVNAVCHRDYFTQEANVVIEVFSDRVKISNPGGLPKGLDPKKFGTQSFPRNHLITSMLHRAQYIEKAGTGIKRMEQAVKNHKKKLKMDIEYSDNSIFYTITFKKAVEKTTQEKSPVTTQEIQERKKKSSNFSDLCVSTTTQEKSLTTTQEILNFIEKTPSITREELAKKMKNISPDGIKYHLEQLKKQGFLKRMGSTKTGYWKILKPKKRK